MKVCMMCSISTTFTTLETDMLILVFRHTGSDAEYMTTSSKLYIYCVDKQL